MIKVMLVDDEKLIREGLKILITLDDEIEVVEEASSGKEAFEKFKEKEIDVILLDIRMPESNGIDAIKLINEYGKGNTKILILTTFKDTEYINEAISLGASGYLLKDSDPESIIGGIKSAYYGNVVLNSEVSEIILNSKNSNKKEIDIDNYKITNRELEIIKLIAEGYSNQEIANKLYLSVGTVKNNISSILQKLELRDRTQIVIFAYDNNLR